MSTSSSPMSLPAPGLLSTVAHRIGAVLALILFWPWTALMTVGVRLGGLVSPRWAHVPHRWWGLGIARLFGLQITVEGLEHLEPFRDASAHKRSGAILAANHESILDIPVLATLPFDFAWIAKVQVSRLPFIGSAMRGLGCFFLRRDGGTKDISVLKVVEDGLRRGESVVIFPEGTRSRTGELLPMKKGAFRTSIEASAPILPIRLRGTYPIAPSGALPRRLGHHISVRIGAPLRPEPGETVEALLERYVRTLKNL